MEFFAILSALRRHRTAAALIVFEIAMSCAIVCNTLFLIGDRLTRMDLPSGIVEDAVRVQLAGIGKAADANAITAQDLAALRALPGVKSAACIDMIPFNNGSWDTTIWTVPDDKTPQVESAMYFGTPGVLETLGVQLIAGRGFLPEEYVDFHVLGSPQAKLPSAILTRALAERLFPGKSALGQAVYIFGKDPQTVVGVIDYLTHPDPIAHPNQIAYSLLLPLTLSYASGGGYILRVEPARRQEVVDAVDATLRRVNANRILLDRGLFTDVRRSYFKNDRAAYLLGFGVSIALLVITGLGVVGLTSFWVQQRRRQIGIRRALGATRGDILRYFQLENFILVTIGIVIGMALAYAINLWLMQNYHVPRLPASFLPIGAALLWVLGQIAVLGPAIRAALISPAIATRSV